MFTAGRCGAYGSASRWYREGSRFDPDHRLQLLDIFIVPSARHGPDALGYRSDNAGNTAALRPRVHTRPRLRCDPPGVAPDGIDHRTLVDCPGRTSWVITWYEGTPVPAGSTPALHGTSLVRVSPGCTPPTRGHQRDLRMCDGPSCRPSPTSPWRVRAERIGLSKRSGRRFESCRRVRPA